MNILFLSRLYSPHIGGVEKHVEKISEVLVKKGHTITIVTSQHDKKLKLRQGQGSTKIFRIPTPLLKSKFSTWQWIVNHKKLFQKANIIHAHDVFWWYLPLRFLMPFKPVFTTFHGWEGIYPPTKKAIAWRKLSEILSTDNICVGDFISKWYSTKPGLVIYGATDQQPLPASRNKNHILVVGRLSHDNDTDLIVNALKKVKKSYPKVKVIFLGDGALSSQAKTTGTVTGFKKNITSHLKNTNLVIASSYLSILDSLAASRSVFSVYSNPLKKDYLTFHPASEWFNISSSSQELASQLLTYFTDPKPFHQKIKPAQSWAHKQTWPKLTDQYLKLWKRLV